MKENSQNGQGLVEYLILVCLVSVSAISIVSVVGTNLREKYEKISAALRGDRSSLGDKTFTTPNATSYQTRGMDDFTEGAQ